MPRVGSNTGLSHRAPSLLLISDFIVSHKMYIMFLQGCQSCSHGTSFSKKQHFHLSTKYTFCIF